jgi:hypothetical protein
MLLQIGRVGTQRWVFCPLSGSGKRGNMNNVNNETAMQKSLKEPTFPTFPNFTVQKSLKEPTFPNFTVQKSLKEPTETTENNDDNENENSGVAENENFQLPHNENSSVVSRGDWGRRSFPSIDMLVIRCRKDGSKSMAKPCVKCLPRIQKAGVRYVYYTDWDGNIQKELAKDMENSHVSFVDSIAEE